MPGKRKIAARKTLASRTIRPKSIQAKAMRRRSASSSDTFLPMHFGIAFAACLLLLALALIGRGSFLARHTEALGLLMTQSLGLEHDKPASIHMVIARKGMVGYIAIDNASPGALRISVPGDWKRLEVKNAPLAAVVAEDPSFGFVRWTLPAGAGLRMSIPSIAGSFHFINSAQTTAGITIQTVDLGTQKVKRDVVLVQKEADENLWRIGE